MLALMTCDEAGAISAAACANLKLIEIDELIIIMIYMYIFLNIY